MGATPMPTTSTSRPNGSEPVTALPSATAHLHHGAGRPASGDDGLPVLRLRDGGIGGFFGGQVGHRDRASGFFVGQVDKGRQQEARLARTTLARAASLILGLRSCPAPISWNTTARVNRTGRSPLAGWPSRLIRIAPPASAPTILYCASTGEKTSPVWGGGVLGDQFISVCDGHGCIGLPQGSPVPAVRPPHAACWP
jgi:hypothetical protein